LVVYPPFPLTASSTSQQQLLPPSYSTTDSLIMLSIKNPNVHGQVIASSTERKQHSEIK
jgi:hypothetical protein